MIPVESLTEVPEGFIGIYTAGELDDIRNRSEVNYILMNDIDLSDYANWQPLSIKLRTFDGNGHIISNMRIHEDNASLSHYGIFGKVFLSEYVNTVIKNLAVVDSSIYVSAKNEVSVGSICGGQKRRVSLSNCHSEASITVVGNAAVNCGGLAGCAANLEYCVNIGNISVEANAVGETAASDSREIFIGGCAGYADSISNCENYGKIRSGGGNIQHIGGIVGKSRAASYAENYGYISVNDTDMKKIQVGGICGLGLSSKKGIEHSRNYGSIKIVSNNASGLEAGGIAGCSQSRISYCKNLSDIFVDDYCKNKFGYVGGICGQVALADTTCCANAGNIAVFSDDIAHAGGIAGNACDISLCYNTGNIYVYALTYAYVGGLHGGQTGYPSITDSYNIGNISAKSDYVCAGGIIGGEYRAEIASAYNTGNIEAVCIAGSKAIAGIFRSGIVGSSKTVKNSYYITSAGIVGDNIILDGTALSEAEFRDKSKFEDFDFDTVWEIGAAEGYLYPTLRENPH